ncbi:YdcF family protein [Paenibacillaceae bacterium]|nr:YdcF family protein [Paenibacillaceae bacterium]
MAALWLFAIVALWCGYALWTVNSFKEPRSLQIADVGIVLGASLWNDYPSPGLQERLDHALHLYEQGKFKFIIVSGGLDYAGARYTEAEGMSHYLAKHGVPPERLLLENNATSTYENLLFSGRIMQEHGLKQAIIISHEFHAVRALEMARHLKFDAPVASGAKSRVMSAAWNQSREVMAYTKWKLQELLITLGLLDWHTVQKTP